MNMEGHQIDRLLDLLEMAIKENKDTVACNIAMVLGSIERKTKAFTNSMDITPDQEEKVEKE